MWSNPTPTCPINSLLAKCVRQCCTSPQLIAPDQRDCSIDANGNLVRTDAYLNIDVRQSIFDHIIRQKVTVTSAFVCKLIEGGLYSFDLWSLTEANNFSVNDVCDILTQLACNLSPTRQLSLGGSTWIYNNRVVNGPLKMLFTRKLPKLTQLKIQQVSSGNDLLAILECCDNLQKLEISQPSVTDRDINEIEPHLKKCNSRKSVRQLLLPSSLKAGAILRLLTIFDRVVSLKCAQFEQLLQLATGDRTTPKSVMNTLASLQCLIITHPMSCDTINKIVNFCPSIEELRIEVQDGMQLFSITKLAKLKHLEFRNSPTLPTSYLDQILPILKVKGADLESLSLEQFDVIDLITCARLCPNLESMNLQWFTILGYNNSLSNHQKMVKEPFSKLRYLRLRPRSQRNVPSGACSLALSHAKNLVHVELYCCYDLSDSDVQLLFKRNPLNHLQSLILRHGHNVTKEALELFVSRAQDLTFIDCGTPPTNKSDEDNGLPDPN